MQPELKDPNDLVPIEKVTSKLLDMKGAKGEGGSLGEGIATQTSEVDELLLKYRPIIRTIGTINRYIFIRHRSFVKWIE